MAPVPVALLTRPSEAPDLELASLGELLIVEALPALGEEEFEVIVDSDKLMRACSCRSSSDQPY